MKWRTCLLFLLCFSGILIAQVPDKMSYQAVIRDSSNLLLTSSPVGMQFSIIKDSATAAPLYIETHAVSTDVNGLISVEIGSGSPISGSMSAIDWSNGIFFLKVETDLSGGTSYSLSGTSQLLSVPFAQHAKTAERISGPSGYVHYVGEYFEGGIVFEVHKDAAGQEHGIIVSIVDATAVGTFVDWGFYGIDISGCESGWDGQSNTDDLMSASAAPGTAAYMCDSFSHSGYTDWYLPSIQELQLIASHSLTINRSLATIPSSQALPYFWGEYWSSSEAGPNNAMICSFSANTVGMASKTDLFIVRAVRAF